jgi:cytochrome c oxidase subunit I+III
MTGNETPPDDVSPGDAAGGGEEAADGGVAGEAVHDDHAFPPKSSVKRWFVTTNHKDVGLLYLVTSLLFLVLGGVLALLMRTQLWVPRAPGTGPLSALA